jgi:nucleoside 2-deoxyribosyltransferase
MLIYLAGRYSRKEELRAVADMLNSKVVTVTSRWLYRGMSDDFPNMAREDVPSEHQERFARQDLQDIREADAFVVIADPPRTPSRGGKHVEFGYALALGKEIWVIGPSETVFHHLPQVRHVDTLWQFVKEVGLDR